MELSLKTFFKPYQSFQPFRSERIERARLPGFNDWNVWNDSNEIFKTPWYGYELGCWSDRNREAAELALQGKHFEIGERAKRERKKLE